jgi:replication initiation protein RepC
MHNQIHCVSEQEARAFPSAAREHAAIPAEYSKTALINLIAKVAKPLGLTSTDLRVMQRIAEKTRASDYHSKALSPICYERQIDMAGEIGLSTEQWRRVERKLEALSLISRDTGTNGYRGGCAGLDGTRIRAGLSLEPLIERRDALEELKEQSEAMRSRAHGCRLEISMQRRRLTRITLAHPEHPIAQIILISKASWKRPRDYGTVEALFEHNLELDALVQRSAHLVVDVTPWYANMTGGAVISDRCHIQNTTENEFSTCNDPSYEDPIMRTARRRADIGLVEKRPDDRKDCLENKDVGSAAPSKANHIDNLNIEQIKDLASNEMRFYIDNLNPETPATAAKDLGLAIDLRAAELGINKSAINLARAVMGQYYATLAVIIIDQNTMHPSAPVRNPGAVLRSFIAKYEAGSLNLLGSIHGIWGRRDKGKMQ